MIDGVDTIGIEDNGLRDEIFLRNASCVAALTCLLWDTFTNLNQEYRCIWKGPINRVKSLYLFTRYFALCVQSVNLYLVFAFLSHLPVTGDHCQAWFLFLNISSCLIFGAMDMVLMLRVYILYNCSRKMAALLVFLFLLQASLVTACTSHNLPLVLFGPSCNVQKTPYHVLYFTASVILSQTLLIILTVMKRKVAFGQSPVIKVIVRDGSWIFVLIVSIFITTIPYSLFVRVAKPHLVFVWPISIFSIATCRMIINMQKIPVPGVYASHSLITFTTILDTFELDSPLPSNPRSSTPVRSDITMK